MAEFSVIPSHFFPTGNAISLFPRPQYFKSTRGHLLGGSVYAHEHVPMCWDWEMEGCLRKLTNERPRTGPFSRISSFFFVYCLFMGQKSTLFLDVPFYTLLMSTIFTFYLLISKLKDRSCLFPEIKNCMYNWFLSWKHGFSLFFTVFLRDKRKPPPHGA